jgi:hypothetical protein
MLIKSLKGGVMKEITEPGEKLRKRKIITLNPEQYQKLRETQTKLRKESGRKLSLGNTINILMDTIHPILEIQHLHLREGPQTARATPKQVTIIDGHVATKKDRDRRKK